MFTFRDDPKGLVGGRGHVQTRDVVSFVMKSADVRIMVMSHGFTARILYAVSQTWSISWLWSLKFPKQRRHTLCVWKMTCVYWAALQAVHKNCAKLGQNCHQLQHMVDAISACHDESIQTESKRDLGDVWNLHTNIMTNGRNMMMWTWSYLPQIRQRYRDTYPIWERPDKSKHIYLDFDALKCLQDLTLYCKYSYTEW